MDVCIVLYVHFTHCSTVHTCVHMYIQMVVEVCVATICDSSQSTSEVSFEHDVLQVLLRDFPLQDQGVTFQLFLSTLPGVHNGMCSLPSLTTCWHTCGHSWRGSHGSHCRCGVRAARQHHQEGRVHSQVKLVDTQIKCEFHPLQSAYADAHCWKGESHYSQVHKEGCHRSKVHTQMHVV